MFGWVAEMERRTLIERTKARLARARREGKRLGRAPASPLAVAAAIQRVQDGESIRSAALAVGVKRGEVEGLQEVGAGRDGARGPGAREAEERER
jgi:DNA invertase Pin-like site-specific DNA recombinase